MRYWPAMQVLVDTCFLKADKDKDKVLNFDEFKGAVLASELGLSAFWRDSLRPAVAATGAQR